MQKTLNDIVSEIERHLGPTRNLANIFHELNLFARIQCNTLPSIIYSLLIQNRAYACLSFNLSESVPHWQDLYDDIKSISGFDTVMAYHQSEQDIFLINPQEWHHWEGLGLLVPDSLMVVYTRSVPSRNPNRETGFLEKIRSICDNRRSSETTSATLRKPLQLEQQQLRTTPRYAVPVTNELFHYGNVEAWQNIIESYQKKYTDLKIQIFHRDKPVYRISSLFKWGKVSVGDVIHFSVRGSEFRDMAKLKKYLTVGASARFLPFIKKNVNSSLELF
ncbi:MAG: hypothetical protein HN580_23525 [Deltaproteobacteria bacterium]|jgi:hypothetical protein|nr:hypothetical protein [Deltaproteobacteria bacterium]MBT4264427.1 hypothetical protein [Deltaproteobacteria bacterium]MBT4643090.1 hypothetical protein [Deltaproteobacteria bacterium]MBT6498884.1 hypothetical protein [Deltaproteobacteria bacterium]MBT6615809.1 hypothetical protein [Deltaproteobacteria bacterium]